ncbi:MAG: GxxExxY protein [Verrucomicrobiota bacterium]
MKESGISRLCDMVRECSFALHNHLRHGHLEKVYENGLVHRLRKLDLSDGQQITVPVYDDGGTILGDLHADLLVSEDRIVELKGAFAICGDYLGQLIGYFRSSRKRDGLLINFGNPRLYIQRYALDPIQLIFVLFCAISWQKN